MPKIKMVFFAANPKNTARLALGEEVREITAKIDASQGRDNFDIISAWATRPDDLLQYLNAHRPQIVHFGGHGSSEGEIVLQDISGKAKPVSALALKRLFTTLKDNIKVVVLNACYSEVQGKAIGEVIDYVVGMKDAIPDEAAIVFAASFYRALGFDRTVEQAFDQAVTALLLEGIPEEDTPVLLVNPRLSRPRDRVARADRAAPVQQAAEMPVEARVKGVYVDRDDERRLFGEMLAGETGVHVLLIEAESGMGKTWLLDQFWELAEEHPRARIDFSQASKSLGDVVGEMLRQYDQFPFDCFRDECRNLVSQSGYGAVHDALLCAKLDLLLAKMGKEERLHHQRLITRAVLVDLEANRKADRPLVLMLDAYEKASDAIKAWIGTQLIADIRAYPRLICIVSGQPPLPRIPPENSECLQHTLEPLSVEHEREYIEKVIYTQDEAVVSVITRMSKGHPHTLQQLVLMYVQE